MDLINADQLNSVCQYCKLRHGIKLSSLNTMRALLQIKQSLTVRSWPFPLVFQNVPRTKSLA